MTPNEIKPCKLAVMGEAPGKTEEEQGRPFVGFAGQLLFSVLGSNGISRNEVSILNVSQHRPLSNDFNRFEWSDPEVQLGVATALAELETVKPNVVLACGNAAFHLLTQGNVAPPNRRGHDWPLKISNYRGSVVPGFYPFAPKIVASFHPSAILRSYGDLPLFKFDVARAAKQAQTSTLPVIERRYEVQPTVGYIVSQLARIRQERLEISIDIEGGVGNITCIGVATNAVDAFIIPFGERYWSLDEEYTIWCALAETLADASVPKILQNYLYDSFVLGWWARCHVRGLRDDTMLAHWELFPELPKALDLQCSIYTLQPYYKAGRKATWLEHLEYCLTDCTVTYECRDAIIPRLKGKAETHYRMNVDLLTPFLYMQTRGTLFDREAVKAHGKELTEAIGEMQHAVNVSLGRSLEGKDKDTVVDLLSSHCCKKRAIITSENDLLPNVKAPWQASMFRIVTILKRWPDVTKSELGFLESELGFGINVDSPKQMKELLYDELNFPPQYKKERGRRTDKPSTDALALLTLYTKTKDRRLYDILRLRQKVDQQSALKLRCDDDGRMRCSYSVVGTDTGRVSSYATAHGTGGNMQNRTKKQRHFWRADSGYWYAACDLVGADGYTVAARSASLGDRTMLDDYAAGAKPKNIVALMFLHGATVSGLTRAELNAMAKAELEPDGWLVFATKVGQHGGSYLMGENTVSDTILKLSFKFGNEPIYVEPHICGKLLKLFLGRYPGIGMWHRDCNRRLVETGVCECASGHTRRFYGRRNDQNTLRAYLAEEPQQNTTYLTNMAALALWNDPENRNADGSLIMEPLHQVHDALNVQFPKDRLDWARVKLRQYFNNPITIGTETLTIPFEGTFGPSWGEVEGDI